METPPDKYHRQLLEAWTDLHQMEALQRKITERVDKLRELIRATAYMLPSKDERQFELTLLDFFKHPTNITEAVRLALYIGRFKAVRLTPIQIREAAESRGFGFSEYSNPMASIHTILRRMREANPPEVDFDEDDGTYALGDGPPMRVNPALLEQIDRRTWQRLIERQSIEQEKYAAAVDELTSEVLDEAFRKIFAETEP
jgi:hypothetical protein